jgi:hypothetical protein
LISQVCYATGEEYEQTVLKQLLGKLDLNGVQIKVVALKIEKSFLAAPSAAS